ncbi:sialate O-acetylesterase [Flavobacterium subsaxonicum]|uniref:Sialate O-acetylesterase n=1 Tax=Flavobacterium subsaxonicum WB 4.1-42 = DSM 21790 TaxID=1121898 RepID=A0A0A2MRU9_9FLAO|nr:sialate O-acetylesterase [Flavobacterium subsaxonicum]KGO94311.1 sialate O-acetylesterase [Flavobacterium subsaxonicum WB 4.1-42 = DSM 21790]
MESNTLKKLLKYLLLALTGSALGNVSLPAFFADNMVLQRNAEVKLWGWGNPSEPITITTGWDNKEYKVKPNNQANWEITIQTTGAGGPYTLSIKGYNELTFTNVMLGEVWLCSGQSNMEWTPSAGIDNGAAEIAAANYPNIRFFTVPKLTAKNEQINLTGNWQVCTPETMKYFSAIGYFFAQHLQEDLKNVPIGIINSSWGGTPAEIWMPTDYIAKDEVVASAAAKIKPVSYGPTEGGRAYNAMIHPLAGFKIAGVLWYQGESNVGSQVYNKTLGALIASWRAAWQDNFSFYFVQIAPYKYGGDGYHGVIIRDAQRRVLHETENTGMVVISDVSPTDDIHPRNKKPVGERLANLALSAHYKVSKGVVSGPLYKSHEVRGSKLIVQFDNAQALTFKDKTNQFEIAGADGVYHPATAKIDKSTVVLTSKDVKKPLHVRYAWGNTLQANLFNGAGLPASSFISE